MNSILTTKQRFFTLAKANNSLVFVRPVVAEIMDNHKKLVNVQMQIEEVNSRIPNASEEDALIYEKISDDLYDEMNTILDRITHNVEELRIVGCVFKDFQVGIVDFPTHFNGRDVYLCWQFGEHEIRNWHEMEEGFTGRNTIDSHFLANFTDAETVLA